MSLLDEAIAESYRGPRCSVGDWLRSLPSKERAEVEEAMADPRPQHAALARAIRARWSDAPGVEPLTRHRKKGCACGTR